MIELKGIGPWQSCALYWVPFQFLTLFASSLFVVHFYIPCTLCVVYVFRNLHVTSDTALQLSSLDHHSVLV